MIILPSHVDAASANAGSASGLSRVVAIGNFDGVHLGHQRLFAMVRELADAATQAAVLTFTPHPARFLAPALAPPLIATQARKRELIAACGIDLLIEEPFDAALAARSPASFVADVLIAGLRASHVCVGYDFTFGKGRSGTVALLAQLLGEQGSRLSVLPPVSVTDPEPIQEVQEVQEVQAAPGDKAAAAAAGGDPCRIVCSSSFVRQAVLAGRPERAALVLGRDPEIEGVVVRGAGRGATIGVPTANLRPDTELLPAPGVYAAWAEVLSDRKVISRHPAAVNVGYNPTFASGQGTPSPLSIEAHLILSSTDAALPPLLGRPLRLGLRRRLRQERRFSSVGELVAQIHKDIEAAAGAVAAGEGL